MEANMRSIFLTAVLLGLHTGSAIAAETCEDYAAQAAATAVKARQLGCMGMTSTVTLSWPQASGYFASNSFREPSLVK